MTWQAPFRHPGPDRAPPYLRTWARVDLILSVHYPEKKGGDDMTMPGFITGQPISGQQVGQAIVQFLPAFPGEGPPFMPRVLARALFPQGFVPGRFPAAQVIPPVAPPVQPPTQPAPPVAAKVVPQPAPAQPRQDRSLDPEMITARAVREKVPERRGMM